ncbi:hypothetical protein DESUT3_40130 [Desulfuromonas versatilis]|uniref:N-formylglutamate amidohydrolase n=1 Tax=Desulfuromonas versatilis TaxID=2802975 RepID=A0ABM8I0X3_9BACT|nr:N-formylglutamate amidohydrolase [Desulfuromonas versatilis]BCR06944.1 hypothetical protein DESUT3_40130 [Desulfuromonas versatilis]
MSPEPFSLLISCEHGGNQVPGEYRQLFAGHQALLQTHRGYDIGILPLARRLAEGLGAPLAAAEVTRLLVDLNRSRHSPTLFSFITKPLAETEREKLLERYYHPYRRRVERLAGELAGAGGCLHLSIHSFTPELHGRLRNADLGLLYDPRRPLEREFCLAWQQQLAELAGGWRVRRNYPYRGASDALVTHLRRNLPPDRYLGIELEVNQRIPVLDGPLWEQLQEGLLHTLVGVLEVRKRRVS